MRHGRVRAWIGTVATTFAATYTSASPVGGQETTERRVCEVIATMGAHAVCAEDLRQRAERRLLALRTEEYAINRQVLNDLLSERLLEDEAAARGISVSKLTEIEVNAKVKDAKVEEVKAIYDADPERYRGMSADAAHATIARKLRIRRRVDRLADVVGELRSRATIKIMLPPPRVSVGLRAGAIKGDADAPVKIVAFGDFQCAPCARVMPMLDVTRQQYGGRVALAFRHFPLHSHEKATDAAEAAECAREEGKFWEMHERLYRNQGALGISDLRAYAGEIGLNDARFVQCIESGRAAATVARDREEGEASGVRATPTVFVNGRLIGAGALRNAGALAEVVEEELALVGPEGKAPLRTDGVQPEK
jgi:protein-disulfide isomerase